MITTADGDTVRTGTVRVQYSIRIFHMKDGDQFDWIASNGDESDELFWTKDAAESDFTSRF